MKTSMTSISPNVATRIHVGYDENDLHQEVHPRHYVCQKSNDPERTERNAHGLIEAQMHVYTTPRLQACPERQSKRSKCHE